MAYIPVYSSRINWENEPSIVSPINATNLNKMDYALKAHDDTLANWDITKANESDLLLALKNVSYDTDTGEFVFTWFNGNTTTVDLNIEKIPVSFSMDANGVITMTTEDGTQYTADVGALIKTYTFTDSSEINFTVTTDASGNKTVTASIVAGSIDGTKLVPNYLADCVAAKTDAETAEGKAEGSAEDAEAWAVGTRGGVPVPSTDPAYENNAEWWATHTSSSFAGLTDTDITNPQNGQVPVYNSTTNKWENQNQSAGGGSTVVVTTSESSLYGQSVTLSDGVTTLTETFSGSGEATFGGVTLTGTLTVSASYGGQTATRTISVPYFGNYTTSLSFFTATITVTFDASKGATCTLDGLTVSTSPYSFTVNSAGTYTASCTLDGVTKQGTAKVITTDGQAETDTIEYGTINLTYDNDFRGVSITCAQGGTTTTKTAPSGGNTMAFYPPTTGTWVIEGTVGGSPYSTNASVTSLSTPVPVSLETIPDGSTKTPTDDVSIWLLCAGIKDKSYTTLSQVIGDSETFNALLGDSNACAYLARSTTFASTLCADQYSMNLIGQYDTACDALLSDATWLSAIANSTYWESVLKDSNPIMTSNTAPSGLCFASSSQTNFAPYYAFNNVLASNGSDGSSGACWAPTTGSASSFIGYKFASPIVVNRINVRLGIYQPSAISPAREFVVQGSNDTTDGTDGTWTDITTHTFDLTGKTSLTYFDDDIVFDNDTAYVAYRLDCDSVIHVAGSYAYLFDEIKFYGRTTSSEKIHGGNPTYDSFYRIVDGNHVPVTDPSLLDAGTYTIYSNGLAKDPSDLSADYGKTIRICPNTKEILVRPDISLYWCGNLCESITGGIETTLQTWDAYSRSGVSKFSAPILNDTTFESTPYNTANAYASGYSYHNDITLEAGDVLHVILEEVTGSTSSELGNVNNFEIGTFALKAYGGSNNSWVDSLYVPDTSTPVHKTLTGTGKGYISVARLWNPNIKCSAIWIERA